MYLDIIFCHFYFRYVFIFKLLLDGYRFVLSQTMMRFVGGTSKKFKFVQIIMCSQQIKRISTNEFKSLLYAREQSIIRGRSFFRLGSHNLSLQPLIFFAIFFTSPIFYSLYIVFFQQFWTFKREKKENKKFSNPLEFLWKI